MPHRRRQDGYTKVRGLLGAEQCQGMYQNRTFVISGLPASWTGSKVVPPHQDTETTCGKWKFSAKVFPENPAMTIGAHTLKSADSVF
jgi:hypothetical protein